MRIAVLGLGFMGSTHIQAIGHIPALQLAAVYSSDEAKLSGDLRGIQGNLGGPGVKFDFTKVAKYKSLEALLADATIEAVDLCLPTDLHASVTLAALRAGKHVLVEKPIALDATTARSMIETARSHGRILMAAQVLRFFPVYDVLRQRLRSGELGAVRAASFRRRCAAPTWSQWLKDASRSGGGVFDLLIHDVDICTHLFGAPDSVSATGYEALAAGIDILNAQLRYPAFTVTVSGGWHHPKAFPFSMEYTVVSDRGTLEYGSAGRAPTLYNSEGVEEALPMPEVDGYAAEIAYFAECCRTGTQPVLCPPEESADAVALTRLLLEARSKNGEWMKCTL